jgi:hypothetical protein
MNRGKVKVKCTLVQALRFCTGRTVKCTLVQAVRLCTGRTENCTVVQPLRFCTGRTVKCTLVQAVRLCTGRTVKCTLVQALRLCTGRTAHKGSRVIAVPFHDHGTRRGEGSGSRSGRSLPRGRPGTYCTGGWVGPRAGLDRCGKSCFHRDSIPGQSSP